MQTKGACKRIGKLTGFRSLCFDLNEPEKKTSDRLEMQKTSQPQMRNTSAHHLIEASCYTSQLPLRSGVGRRLAASPGRLAPVPMYSMSNRNFGTGRAIPRTGLVWKRRLMQSSTNAIRPAATTTLKMVSKTVSVRSTGTEPTLRFHCGSR